MKLGLMLSILIATIAMTRMCAEGKKFECTQGRLEGSAKGRPEQCSWSLQLQCYKIAYLIPNQDGSESSLPAEWIRHKGCAPRSACERVEAYNTCKYGQHRQIWSFPGLYNKIAMDRIRDTTSICCCNTTRCNSGQADCNASLPLAALLLLTSKLSVELYC